MQMQRVFYSLRFSLFLLYIKFIVVTFVYFGASIHKLDSDSVCKKTV